MKHGIYIVLLLISLRMVAQENVLPSTTEAHYGDVKFLQDEQLIQDVSLNASSLNRLLYAYEAKYTSYSPQYAECVLWCAYVCAKKGDNVQGLRALEAGQDLFKKYGNGCFEGKDTINEIFSLDIKTNIEYNIKRYYIAIKSASRSCELKKAYFGDNSEIYLKSLLELSHLYALYGDYTKTSYYHNIAYEAYVERIKEEFSAMNETERSMYWEKAQVYTDYTTMLAHVFHQRSQRGKNESLASAAYNAALLTKGLLLNTSIMAALRREGQTLELPHLTIRWEDVAAQLSNNDVAIEFYKTEEDEYGALILKRDWNSPKLVRLSTIVAPNQYVVRKKKYPKLADALQSMDAQTYSKTDFLWLLSQAIWTDDIVKYFPTKGDGRVYFAAVGALQTLGMESLPFVRPTADGNYISFSDVYQMCRLSSTRELAIDKRPIEQTSATLYGGIYYQDMDSSIMRQISKKYKKRELQYSPSYANDTTRRSIADYLPGTLKEIDSIRPVLANRHVAVSVHSKRDACEESVKALSGHKPTIIHIATHGFYWKESSAKKDPMERSGLLFAGANTALSGHVERLAKDIDDGILTSKEISLLDLHHTDMVVLSACETGLGDITSDGVFGLQRAFKIAGAKTILMALWKVDDEATRLLMTAFYRNYCAGQTKRQAFRNAQQEVRNYTRIETQTQSETITVQPYKDPYYWAGFIMLD